MLKDDLAQFYLVVDLVLELLTGHRHKPPRLRMEFLTKGGHTPRRQEKTWPTLVVDLKRNIKGDPIEFIQRLDSKVAEHVMSGRRPDRLAFYLVEPDTRAGEKDALTYWSAARETVGNFPIERAYAHTKPQYTGGGR